jgi:short subunit dehydrogenase-like uncharacterized protein
MKKLEKLVLKLTNQFNELPKLEYFVVDIFDLEQVWKMTSRTKVVINLVGPYSLYSNNVVHSCVKNGTDYLDITGEVDWVKYNYHRYKNEAISTGSRLIFSSGYESVPFDIATYILNKEIKNDEEDEMREVYHGIEMIGGCSGGSFATIISFLDKENAIFNFPELKDDPLQLHYSNEHGYTKSTSKILNKNLFGIAKIDKSRWRFFSPVSIGNFEIIKMSQSQLNYSSNLSYNEYFISYSLLYCLVFYVGGIMVLNTIFLKPLRQLLLYFGVIPKPGQGPSEKDRRKFYSIIESKGVTKKGKTITLVSSYNEDVGYVGTARIIAESALCFIFNDKNVQQRGGILTSASAFGDELVNRLEESGTEFKMV